MKLTSKEEFRFLITIIVLLICLFVIYADFFLFHPDRDYKTMNLKDYNKLMIVAHPDDEIIWGGAHLIEDNYLVVCITCGRKKERVKEFKSVMKKTNDKYIMLGYRDKTKGHKDNWKSVVSGITEDLQEIINLKDWDMIVTHNPYGEYGHIHHKITNRIVRSYANKDKLYYFGIYYSKKSYKKLTEPLPRIDDNLLNIKVNELLPLYESQKFIMTTFDQMFPHENFIKATDWNYKEKGLA